MWRLGLRIRPTTDTDEDEKLLPEDNPMADILASRQSLSGVRYGDVLSGVNILYPPEELESRNAESRSDGYWPYVESGEAPPKQFTYGEFDFFFFAELLDLARKHSAATNNVVVGDDDDSDTAPLSSWDNQVFLDIGSGTGRLVLAAAALHPGLLKSRGIEVLPGIHDVANKNLQRCEEGYDEATDPAYLEEVATKVAAEWSQKATLGGASDDEWLEQFKDQFVLGEDSEDEGKEEEDDDVDDDDEVWVPVGSSPLDNMFSWPWNQNNDNDDNDDNNDVDADSETNPENDLDAVPGYDSASSSSDGTDSIATKSYRFPVNTTVTDTSENDDPSLPTGLDMAPVEFTCGSFEDPYLYYGDADVIFVFSSCMSASMIGQLSRSIGRQCRPGTIVITTEFPLLDQGRVEPLPNDPDMPFGPFRIELLESIDGFCWLMGGRSTAHIHRVVESVHTEELRYLRRPVKSKRELAREAIEFTKAQNTDKFLRDVRNRMVFLGLPDSWLPNVD